MLIIKAYYHLMAIIKKTVYKIVFGKKIKFGKGVTFRRSLAIAVEQQGEIIIGHNCFFNNNCSISSIEKIQIGNNTIFGENVCIYDHNHKYKDLSQLIQNQGYTSGEVIIGNNCWIGSNVTILKGAHIGNHVVIGANCVVRGEIMSNTVVYQKDNLHIKEI